MRSFESTFRRNLVTVGVTHVAIIVTLFVLERWMPFSSIASASMPVELVVPADILGDLPQGPGHGKGEYSPPPPTPPPVPSAPSEPAGGTAAAMPAPPDESPAPPSPPNEIAIPKQTKKIEKTPVTKKPATAKTTKPVTTGKANVTGKSTTAPKGPTASDYRQRFLKALGGSGSTGGTPYGDNRPAGGGSGKTKVIGSPDGSPDGVAGGVGPGSPHWQYYMHVHDRMYEAWEQPGSVNDRKLMAVVTIKIARDGNIVGVTLKRSSGNKLMDNSALAAARKAQMLEPPPAALVKGSAAEISVEFQMEG